MSKQFNQNNAIVIYQSEDGRIQLDVKLEEETVWLNRQQMAELFDRDVKTIGKHINNALKEELENDPSTVAKFATVQKEGERFVSRSVEYYNLDVIISVGYRVHSKHGVRFRQWASGVLKQYLIKGFAVNERIRKQQISELRQLVQVVGRAVQQQAAGNNDESHALFDVVVDYSYALPLVHEQQWNTIPKRRLKTHSRQHFGSAHADDSRESHRRKGRNGKGCGKFNQQQ